MSEPLQIAVFASGRGSNFLAIHDAITSGTIRNAAIVVVVSNNSDAGALAAARERGISALHISSRQFDDVRAFRAGLLAALERHGVNFIALAGYMKKVDAEIVRAYRHRIVNIHPALLPAFGGPGMYGMHVHDAVIASGARESGATVHLVDEEYDRGAIVLQERVAIAEGETSESLAAKVLAVEHALYPRVIGLFAEGRVRVEGHQVIIA